MSSISSASFQLPEIMLWRSNHESSEDRTSAFGLVCLKSYFCLFRASLFTLSSSFSEPWLLSRIFFRRLLRKLCFMVCVFSPPARPPSKWDALPGMVTLALMCCILDVRPFYIWLLIRGDLVGEPQSESSVNYLDMAILVRFSSLPGLDKSSLPSFLIMSLALIS
jgi:hypothetical protein